ncbi:MAG: MATE family efflux transporter [Aquabacterium sp.]
MTRLSDTARRIAPLAWPVFVGQVSVLAFSTVDTVLLARYGQADLSAFAIGASTYITVFIGLMGVVLALGPVAGRLFGARDLAGAGAQLKQTLWMAAFLSLAGSLLLLWPQPFLALARATPEMADKVRGYLMVLALSLPASLMFTCFRAFNTAVSRPKAVMVLQLGGLALKVPLSMLFINGWAPIGLPALGVTGCAVATLCAMWAQALLGWLVLRHDRFYAPFMLRGWVGPDFASIRAQLRLGLPMGLAIVVEVSGFSFMAFLIARTDIGAVAGHQIAANLVSLLFMMPLALSSAVTTLVAQAIGAGAALQARQTAWHGVSITLAMAALMGGAAFLTRAPIVGLYTDDAAIAAAALPLVAWVALFHVADAAQTVAAFVLRAWHIATVPLLIYVTSLAGVGLGGGMWLQDQPWLPVGLAGAPAYWLAATVGVVLAGMLMCGFLAWVMQQKAR